MAFYTRTTCPGCLSTQSNALFACAFTETPISDYLSKAYSPALLPELNDGKYILSECTNCKLIYQKQILTDEKLKRFYEKWTNRSPLPQKLDLSKEIEILQEVLTLCGYFNRPAHSLSFLDFGMGEGKWVQIAQSIGCAAYGYDFSCERIAQASEKGIQTLTENELETRPFDFINTEQVFEHVARPLEILEKLKARLNPGGLIKISVPNGRNIKKKLAKGAWSAKKGSKKDLNPIAPIEHINCFTYDALIEMGKAAELEEVKMPLSLQYHYALRWNSWKWLRKNLIKPLKRNYLSRGTYLFFKRTKEA